MPKMKTNKSVNKRFRFSKKGKIKRAQAFKSHLLSHKRRKRKRALRRTALVSEHQMERIGKLLPYA
jgi:large subunit ribosomal protein L35